VVLPRGRQADLGPPWGCQREIRQLLLLPEMAASGRIFLPLFYYFVNIFFNFFLKPKTLLKILSYTKTPHSTLL
jgi:hypothetical protein